MKKLVIVIILLAGGLCSCGENANLLDAWVCETVAWENEKATTITLKFYPTSENEGKFHSAVTNGSRFILFRDDVWLYYKIEGDMMYVRGEHQEFPTEGALYNKWTIRRHIEGSLLELDYAGILPAIPITRKYLFLKQQIKF